MRDAKGRTIDYMRVSITDRCNLRCQYCMPENLPFIPHDSILRYEEILRLCAAMAGMGIKHIKVTGGEPLSRKGWLPFVQELKAVPGIEHVTLTTNAVLLEPYVDALAELGLDGVNISLDSLNSGTYLWITGRDEFGQVWKTLHKTVEAGLRVKVNCVPIMGVNDNEILSFARLAEDMPVDIRFIELMPTEAGGQFHGVSGTEILTRLQSEYPDLTPDETQHGFGPARYFRSARLQGSFGVIDAVTNHFCSTCNRLRLTSEGFLKLCLSHGDGMDLRGMLRGGMADAEIEAAIRHAVYNKPERHCFGSETNTGSGIKKMSQIGG